MQKHIALTFDDGPNTSTTLEVLDLIEQYGITATFFAVGNNINENSAKSMQRAVSLGCEIENHSRTHSALTDFSAEEISAEIEYTDEKISAAVGRKPQFFRPPYIAYNRLMFDSIEHTFICGVGADDWMDEISPEMRYEKIIAQAQDGTIILLHDAEGNFRTVEALKKIIPALLEQGYEFVTVSDMFRKKGVTPKKGIIYTNVFQQ